MPFCLIYQAFGGGGGGAQTLQESANLGGEGGGGGYERTFGSMCRAPFVLKKSFIFLISLIL